MSDRIVIGFTASRTPEAFTVEGYINAVNRVVKRLEADGFVTGAGSGSADET